MTTIKIVERMQSTRKSFRLVRSSRCRLTLGLVSRNDLKRSASMDQLRNPGYSYDDARTPTAPFHPGSSEFIPSHGRAASSSVLQSRPRRTNPSASAGAMLAPPLSRANSSSSSKQNFQPASVTFLPGFPNLGEAGPLPPNTLPGQAARSVWSRFVGHMEALLDSIRALRLDQFEANLRGFWMTLSPDEKEVCHSPSL